MIFFKWIFRLCWIGFCAVAMLAQTRLVLHLPLAPGWLDGYVFGSTIFAYGFTHPDRQRSAAAWLAGLGGGLCFVMPFFTSGAVVSWQWAALIPLTLWLCYYGLQRPGRAGLRGVPVAKPVVVSLTWAVVTVLLPTGPERWPEVSFIFAGRTVFIFALALAYDLSDVAYDKRHGLSTLAGRWGPRKTFRVTDAAFLVSSLCYGANAALRIFSPEDAFALVGSLVFSAWWLRFLLRRAEGGDWQKTLIDALMPLQFILVAGVEWISQVWILK